MLSHHRHSVTHTEEDIKIFDDINKLRERIHNIDNLTFSSLENVHSKNNFKVLIIKSEGYLSTNYELKNNLHLIDEDMHLDASDASTLENESIVTKICNYGQF